MSGLKLYSILGISFAYAIIRYHIFSDVPWSHFPLFISNKAISMAGLIFLGLALVQSEKSDRKALGQWGAALIGIHILISFIILNEHYFEKFFVGPGEMTFQAEVSMIAGIIGTIFMCALLLASNNGNGNANPSQLSLRIGWGRAILVLAAIHLAFMGYTSWLTPSKWYGYLPPITLISFLVALVFFVRRRKSSKE